MNYIAVRQHHKPGRTSPEDPVAIGPGTLTNARLAIERDIDLLKSVPASPAKLVIDIQCSEDFTIVYFRDGSRTEYWISYIGEGVHPIFRDISND